MIRIKRKKIWAGECRARITGLAALLIISLLLPLRGWARDSGDEPLFTVRGYELSGNTRIDTEELLEVVSVFTGENKSSNDVERAREALEIHYQTRGYPAVMVNIPEQTVDSGIIRLEVVESLIRMVRVTGNRYHTMEMIRDRLPSLTPGTVLYVPLLKKELNLLNRNRDLKVAPVLAPGREPGTIDVELKVRDRLPLHASLELSDRYSADTTRYRLNGSISYDNLWQKQHSLSFQYQTAPEKTDEVQVASLSYMLPAPWDVEDMLVFYGVLSDSNNSFGDGFTVLGSGNVFGIRCIVSLPGYGQYSHNLSIGIDYKDFDEELGIGPGTEPVYTPITYMPLVFSYSGSRPDDYGLNQFSAGLNFSVRGLVSDQRQFEVKRYDSRGDFLYLTLGLERYQKMFRDIGLYLKADGQVASEPLISNEQYSAGGMTSVRGYLESEKTGDNALHFTAEISRPVAEIPMPRQTSLSLTPYIFYDYAGLYTKNALEGQDKSSVLSGTGCGLRGELGNHVKFETVWAVALDDASHTESGDQRMHFLVRFEF